MKHWLIQYSIKYASGRVQEGEVNLEANNITMALAKAIGNILNPLKGDPDIADAVIWGIGIVEDEVF